MSFSIDMLKIVASIESHTTHLAHSLLDIDQGVNDNWKYATVQVVLCFEDDPIALINANGMVPIKDADKDDYSFVGMPRDEGDSDAVYEVIPFSIIDPLIRFASAVNLRNENAEDAYLKWRIIGDNGKTLATSDNDFPDFVNF